MPYTPPAQSPSVSPILSRSSSYSNNDKDSPSPSSTLHLFKGSNPPRSASYMHKHRRSSSVTSPSYSYPLSPTVSYDPRPPGRERNSPPSSTHGVSIISSQAVFSPPDSSQNSSDEEESPGGRRRGRNLGTLEEQLVEAIKSLPQRRETSPDPSIPRKPPVIGDSDRPVRPRIAHHRSSSESILYAPEFRRRGSDSDIEDDAYRLAPPMIRKKSGELVKSSLKSPSRSRPTSMPSTPTFPKNVHFNNIEQVRHFLHSEKPSAVSAGSSPVENFEMETEFPFNKEEPKSPSFEWELVLPNFPKDLDARNHLPVRLEKSCLSNDKKNLIGTVAVANIAFQKSVVARFTFDYWQTVSEVAAEYSNDIRRKHNDGIDRFVFKIKLADQANLENKTLFFCIRYNVGGQEYWDNNGGVNFQIDFKKRAITPSARETTPQGSALPRSKPTHSGVRPVSLPNMDDFELFGDSFFERASELGGRGSASQAKSKSKSTEDPAIPARRANPSGNAFGNRYDFGASLSAAIKAASSAMGPDMGRVQAEKEVEQKPTENPYFTKPVEITVVAPEEPTAKTNVLELPTTTPLDSPSTTGAGPPEVFRPESVFGDKPSIESPSYRELLDNYCFFGTVKSSHRSPSPKTLGDHKEKPVNLPLSTIEKALAASSPAGPPPTPPSLSIAQQKASGNASPIPLNYAGLRHNRRSSGALRFEAPKASTAIC